MDLGPIIRIGPNDVSISDAEFVDAIYAPGPGHRRDKDHEKNKALGVDSSVGGSITHELHQRRREALNPFFSAQRIKRLDPELRSKTSQLESLFARIKESGEVLNLSDTYFGFANEYVFRMESVFRMSFLPLVANSPSSIVHQYSFGNAPNLLGDLSLAALRRTNVSAVLGSVKIMLHFGWIRDLLQLLPHSIGSRMTPPGVRDMIAFRMGIRSQIERILGTSPAESAEMPSIFTHLRDSSALPATEKSAKRLEDEATLITMAGTYSPMLSLATAHYHLLARPDVMAKLRAELAAHPEAATASELGQLPYLNGVVQEAHRLTFGLTGRNPRVCPDETLVYTATEKDAYGRGVQTSYAIPPGTSISASTLLIHTDESIFPDPWRFDPERWIPDITTAGVTSDEARASAQALGRRRRSMLSFMRGPRACIGMHLTNAEMTVALAAAARWDMRLFETDEDDVAFRHDYHVLCPRLGSRGVRVRVIGQYAGFN